MLDLKILFLFIGFSIAPLLIYSQSKADRICGLYYATDPNNGEGSQLQIYKAKDGTYEGKVVWMEFPNHPNGEPRRDVKNPDPQKRNQTNVGIVLIKGFTYNEAHDEWDNGSIYNPVSGKTYRSYMSLEPNGKLKVRGYLGVSLLGKTVIWTKEQTLRK
ncbi:MAG: DUF2147 domain-containing protein [Bacteroidales bacterium]|jgi:uncharacterized protein (DUF2147 family)|nr:DUF2147 domain-containing protein [Bacteroidales bacterium]